VAIPAERQISWRIRADSEVSGDLRIVLPDESLEKSIVAGRGPRYVSDRRVSSFMDALWHPGERMLGSNRVDWIEIRYPSAGVTWFGIELSWIIWFLVISMIAALLFKKRLGVVF
jgi:hypothetical protein